MKKPIIALVAFGILAVLFVPGMTQPPGEKEKGPKKDKKGPPPFELGKVLPPFVRDSLELTKDQEKAIGELEKEVRAKLLKILTDEQVQRLKELKGPKGPPKDKDRPPLDPQSKADPATGGIQWFATWKAGLAEAQRTGKPILLVSAAPHCAGVSGIWLPGKQEMDRSYLSQPQVIAASRQFVCVRLATYEDETEAVFLKGFTPTKSGQLENTVFGMLAPDGKQKLIRSSRGPDHLFSGPAQMAEVMTTAAAKYPAKSGVGPAPLPLVATVKLGVNVAAADNQPLVVIVGKNAAARRLLEDKLASLAWDKEFMGRFIFTSGTPDELAPIEGTKRDPGVLIVEPEKFGRTAKLVSSLPADASEVQIAKLLRRAVVSFKPIEKTFKSHVREGQTQGVFWETAIPVTDPMELRAREKGKKGKN
jgi:hypothetical protein